MAWIEAVFNHIVLPPRLPDHQDSKLEAIELELFNRLIHACESLDRLCRPSCEVEVLTVVSKSLKRSLELSKSELDVDIVLKSFQQMDNGSMVLYHVREQNAALLISKPNNGTTKNTVVEAFELSPQSTNVLGSKDALLWDFPGRAVELPPKIFSDISFQSNLSRYLEQACRGSLSLFSARANKATASVAESRDTKDPALVSQCLMAILEALGNPVETLGVQKRVIDDVNFGNSEIPWRRAPLWLGLRVAVQLLLSRSLGLDLGKLYYKLLGCVLLTELLGDTSGVLSVELSILLRTKLCRRLAKLEDLVSKDTKMVLYAVRGYFETVIDRVNDTLGNAWNSYKQSITRKIPTLPSRARHADVILPLPRSKAYLQERIASRHLQIDIIQAMNTVPEYDIKAQQAQLEAKQYYDLVLLEEKIRHRSLPSLSRTVRNHDTVVSLANDILDLFARVQPLDLGPDQRSLFVLNVFDLWIEIDKHFGTTCPLSLEYDILFSPELLDVLQLQLKIDHVRLRSVQEYLSMRRHACKRRDINILSAIGEDCFAVQFVSQSASLQKLEVEIRDASDEERVTKEMEWTEACVQYDKHVQGASLGSCFCSTDDTGQRSVKGCKRCWHWRAQKRMRITCHEDFLPADAAQSAAAVLELDIPDYIEMYRAVTWKILSQLAHPGKPDESIAPAMVLENYSNLSQFQAPRTKTITLASQKKSFLQTHFKEQRMKVESSSILLPNSLEFAYYDSKSKTWVADLDLPLTLQHLVGVYVPQCLANTTMKPLEHPRAFKRPTSYEIVAGQAKCPAGVSTLEYISYQNLLLADKLRWMTVLTEMGSANINFSSEDTMLVLTQLTVQAGPMTTVDGKVIDCHHFLRDHRFCARLLEMLQLKLSAIESNWREHHCMTLIILMLLRVADYSLEPHCKGALKLLIKARRATLRWTATLREQIMSATDPSTVDTATAYGYWAALLCRRTFAHAASHGSSLSAIEIHDFVQATLALRENSVVGVQDLPPTLRYITTNDLQMAQAIRPQLLEGLFRHPNELETAIKTTWGEPSQDNEPYANWTFLPAPFENWVTAQFSGGQYNGQLIVRVIHYNFMQGYLNVNGAPLGRLPNEIKSAQDVQDLFGQQHLLTFPTNFNGMSYRLGVRVFGHDVFFGTKGDRVIIQALSLDRHLFEFIPRRLFTDDQGFDLPASLLDGCVHWLDLDSGKLEIRRKPRVWKTISSDWVLDTMSATATRRSVKLVSPQSRLFSQIVQTFGAFEMAERITVFQPGRNSLSVELRTLDLNFSVNQNGLLESKELQAEVDPDQDAGTLYGLGSKVVLRAVSNPQQRSIITSTGPLRCARVGMHVSIAAASESTYGRFEIDPVLGRLTCAPEPFLIYLKARFHAYTSFGLPDPLTGRTGQEEALSILRSGQALPWTVLGLAPIDLLNNIRDLCPAREYYPTGMQRLQKCTWRDDLTVAIQGDCLYDAVSSILHRSQQLDMFNQNTGQRLSPEVFPDHLRDRAISHRQRFERMSTRTERQTSRKDVQYKSRDKDLSTGRSIHVYQTMVLAGMEDSIVDFPQPLAKVLESFDVIGGFGSEATPDDLALSSVMDIDLGQQWGTLAQIFSQAHGPSDYDSMFRLAILAFNPNSNLGAIRFFAAISRIPDMKDIKWPEDMSFTDFKHHEVPKMKDLQELILQDHPAPQGYTNKKKKKKDVQEDDRYTKIEAESKVVADVCSKQWPAEEPSIDQLDTDFINLDKALKRIMSEWKRLSQNRRLSEIVDNVQLILDRYHRPLAFSPPYNWTGRNVVAHQTTSVSALLKPSIADLSSGITLNPRESVHVAGVISSEAVGAHKSGALLKQHINVDYTSPPGIKLAWILKKFTESPNDVRSTYGRDLEASLDALNKSTSKSCLSSGPPDSIWIDSNIQKTTKASTDTFRSITESLKTTTKIDGWLLRGRLWPCVTPIAVLELLRSTAAKGINERLREQILEYAVQLARLRRLMRMKNATLKSDVNRLKEEWANPGHEGWDPKDHAEWLLMEIESNLMIRTEQYNVAKEVILPRSGQNAVLQLNMGRGKTSCIMPMAAVELANGTCLVRLIVPKPLLLQTAQTLQSRVGGLIGRRLLHIPFSRRTKTTNDILELYTKLHTECLRDGDIILTTPEHLMSFKLSGRQRLVDRNLNEAQTMLTSQDWLNKNCRDILDESDLSLAVKTQLVYPSGTQVSVDGHPYRWKIVEVLLSMVEDLLPGLARQFPRLIEVVCRGTGFPLIYILREDVENALNKALIEQICDAKSALLETKSEYPPWIGPKIRDILTADKFDNRSFAKVLEYFKDPVYARKTLLICRGLLYGGILVLCLKKRWGTQFGLHPARDPIAVPFEAKGVPSEQSEFGHPDVSIVLTCLSFYYSGVTIEQFRQGLGLVLQADDPAMEYDRWSSGAVLLPEGLRHWNVINLDDKMQIHALWGHLRFSRGVLDHFLNNYVFPQHAKQFQVKLQSSGWDLPLFPSQAATTGFSGTNDNKMLLPLTIHQHDLPELDQTSAEVLTYLLEPRNERYHVATRNGKRNTEEELLVTLKDQHIKILIDAGAYIMELDNESLARRWVQIDHLAQAAVYFAADNRAWVYYRGGRKTPLLASPFAENLEGCLVYLDENHTRGVDLKFPSTARGALTLALNQTKDHTVQAAMRLRKLGTTQSIVWVAPPEVDQSIQDFCRLAPSETINSSHVVSWLLEQTCRSNEQLQGLFIAQGSDFCRHFDAVAKNENAVKNVTQRQRLLQAIENPEVQSLEQLYGSASHPQSDRQQLSSITNPALKAFLVEFERRRQNSPQISSHQTSVLEEVEQERQVTQEVQEVRQVQVAPHAIALTFPALHPDIKDFVRTGTLAGNDGYIRALEALVQTSFGKTHGVTSTGSRVWISKEFMRTVQRKGKAKDDNFLRPVEYILFSVATETALIVIPEEAEAVFPLLYSQVFPKVHMISYAVPVTKNMLRFSDLSFYSYPSLPAWTQMPRWLTTEIGLVAGRLYFHYRDYAYLKALVVREPSKESPSSAVSETGGASSISSPDSSATSSVDGGDTGDAEPTLSICSRPAPFLLSYLAMRRHGQDILSTPMGYLCQGKLLTEKHAFFAGFQEAPMETVPAVAAENIDVMEEQDEDAESSEDEDEGAECQEEC